MVTINTQNLDDPNEVYESRKREGIQKHLSKLHIPCVVFQPLNEQSGHSHFSKSQNDKIPEPLVYLGKLGCHRLVYSNLLFHVLAQQSVSKSFGMAHVLH